MIEAQAGVVSGSAFPQTMLRALPLSDQVRATLFFKSEDCLFYLQKYIAGEAELELAISAMVSLYIDLEPKLEAYLDKHGAENEAKRFKELQSIGPKFYEFEKLRTIEFKDLMRVVRLLRAFIEINGITKYEIERTVPSVFKEYE